MPERLRVGCAPTMLRRLRIENLVLIREAELELAPGLNAITGETGAGKTILAQAIGLLLGAKGDAAFVGPAGGGGIRRGRARPAGLLDEGSRRSPSCGPRTRRRSCSRGASSPTGRTRAYAWGRSAAREDVAAAVERAARDVRPVRAAPPRAARRTSSTCSTRFCGDEQLAPPRRARATPGASSLAARRRHEELTRDAAAARGAARRAARARRGHRGARAGRRGAAARRARAAPPRDELAEARRPPRRRSTPEEGEGAAGLVARRRARGRAARAARAGARSARATSCATPSSACARRRRACASFLASLEAEPGRLDEVEASSSTAIAEAKRRFRCADATRSCSRAPPRRGRARRARRTEPIRRRRRREALAAAEARVAGARTLELRAERSAAAPAFADAVAAELRDVGMGDGEFRVRAARARAGRDRAPTRSVVPRPPERGPAVRAGRRDGLRRRALADRARDRGGRGRRDARLRRDRRRHRRRDRARRRPRRCGGSPSARR